MVLTPVIYTPSVSAAAMTVGAPPFSLFSDHIFAVCLFLLLKTSTELMIHSFHAATTFIFICAEF